MQRWFSILLVCMVWAGCAVTAHAQAGPATGPSFDCTHAQGSIEQTICTTATLAADDHQMAALYALARTNAFGTGPSNQLETQRQLVKDMRGCAKPGEHQKIADCLEGYYAQRNNDLAIAVMMRVPDVALPVIRRTDPAFAPVAEAVQLWAAEPKGVDWSAPALATPKGKIRALLAPLLADLQTNADKAYGRDILADPGTNGISVKRIDDIFISERHFAAFLNVLGPYLPELDGPARNVHGRRTLPCAAILGHPALLGATASVFGSTLDNFVFDTDCVQTLPPLPAVATLDQKLIGHWPQCEGTIRFAAYRIYETALDEARLGVAKHVPKVSFSRRRGVTAADIAAARGELAAYYARNFGKSPASAAVMAADALTAVLSVAQECD